MQSLDHLGMMMTFTENREFKVVMEKHLEDRLKVSSVFETKRKNTSHHQWE